MRDDPHHFASPVDLPAEIEAEDALRPALAWTSGAIAIAAMLLLMMNATALHGWAVELPPTPLTARIVATTEAWQETTERIGLASPRATLHGWWKQAQAAR